jgi:hypothetical protein
MSTLRTITGFKSKLAGGGARSNLFEVQIPTLPASVTGWDAETFSFLCKTAALPASNIGSVDIPFRGRTLKVAGDRTFDPWTVTIINDENFKLRIAFEQWANQINKLENAREDARVLAKNFERLGYRVTLKLDLAEKQMKASFL